MVGTVVFGLIDVVLESDLVPTDMEWCICVIVYDWALPNLTLQVQVHGLRGGEAAWTKK